MIVKNIDKVIQQTLKNRERALGRTSPSAGDPVDGLQKPLKIQDMASRTVFVRMISNRSTPVVIQGGQLSNETSVADGEAGEATTQYGVKTAFGYNNVYKKTDDGTIRYLSGIKDISVEYKGQYKAIRTANVNWTIGSLDDLDRLTPHFLTPGLTVLLDYGWVMKEPPSTFFNEGKIDPDAFKNPLPKIYENKGNYDAIAGTVSNFNYKLNEDGTFDCTTTITSLGINLFESLQTDKGANSQVVDEEDKLKVNKDGIINTILNLPRIIIHDVFKLKYDESIEKINHAGSEFEALIDVGSFDAGQNLAGTYLSYSTKYILEESGASKKQNSNLRIDEYESKISRLNDGDAGTPNISLNHYIAYIPSTDGLLESDVIFAKSDYDSNVREDFFVRWGWFEDNIVSRYSSLYADNGENNLINQFRSIDTIMPDISNPVDGTEAASDEASANGVVDTLKERKESVKIRNNENLQFPSDAFKFILPGQHINNVSEIFELPDEWNTDEANLFKFLGSLFNMNNTDKRKFSVADDKSEGYLRNVMINVKEIQKAFGVKNPDDINEDDEIGRFYGPDYIEPVGSIKEGMMNLAKALSANYFDFWDFKITSDTYSDNVKMIDSKQVPSETTYAYTKFVENSHEVQNLGLYKFPTFQLGSIVKSQTLESKIIDAMTITTMYGSNQDKEKKPKLDLTNQSPEVQLLFSQDKGKDYEDKYLNKIQKAYVKIIEEGIKVNKIGNKNSSVNEQVSKEGGFQINPHSLWWASWSAENKDVAWYNKIVAAISQMYTEVTQKLKKTANEVIDTAIDLVDKFPKDINKEVDLPGKDYDFSVGTGTTFADAKAAMKKFAENQKFDLSTKEEIEAKTIQQAKLKADDIANFKKGDAVYLLNGDADNGEQYELGLIDAYVSTIKERLFFTGKGADQFKTDYLHPVDLSLEIDGIAGISPGEIIQSDYMPKKYNKEITNSDGVIVGPFSFFQIFGLTQKVGLDGWTTEVTTVMRVNSKALNIEQREFSSESDSEGTKVAVPKEQTESTSEQNKKAQDFAKKDNDDYHVKKSSPIDPPVTKADLEDAEVDKEVEDETAPVIVGAPTNTSNFGTNTTYRGTAAQNTIIYQLVPLWTPPEAGGAKDTSFYTEAPTGKIPIIIRQMFWDNYIEFPNGNGQSSVTSVTGDMQASVDVSFGYAFPTAKSDLIGFSFNNNVRSKAGKYNTMSYIRSDGEKVSFKKGDTIYFPPPL